MNFARYHLVSAHTHNHTELGVASLRRNGLPSLLIPRLFAQSVSRSVGLKFVTKTLARKSPLKTSQPRKFPLKTYRRGLQLQTYQLLYHILLRHIHQAFLVVRLLPSRLVLEVGFDYLGFCEMPQLSTSRIHHERRDYWPIPIVVGG